MLEKDPRSTNDKLLTAAMIVAVIVVLLFLALSWHMKSDTIYVEDFLRTTPHHTYGQDYDYSGRETDTGGQDSGSDDDSDRSSYGDFYGTSDDSGSSYGDFYGSGDDGGSSYGDFYDSGSDSGGDGWDSGDSGWDGGDGGDGWDGGDGPIVQQPESIPTQLIDVHLQEMLAGR